MFRSWRHHVPRPTSSIARRGHSRKRGSTRSIGAAALVFCAVGLLFGAVAAGIKEALPLWLSLLIVASLKLILRFI
jgi:hypothetical protein